MAEALLRQIAGNRFWALSARLNPLVNVHPAGVVKRLFWPFEDPAIFEGTDDEILDKFCDVRDQIEAQIRRWFQEMSAAA